MTGIRFFKVLEKAFRFYAGFALAVLLFQLTGLIMYFFNIWPSVRDSLSPGVSTYVAIAVLLVLVRSSLWISIYWFGARSFSILRGEGDSLTLHDRLSPHLRTLTRLLVVSAILDMCFVPVIFLSDTLLPGSMSGLWLGVVDLAILLFPQAFGIGALILAFLTHQFGQLLQDSGRMKEEIQLTI